MIILNIGTLYGLDPEGTLRYRRGTAMDNVESLDNAWLRIEGDRIDSWGTMDGFTDEVGSETVVDAHHGLVIPSFCDSHTHIVFPGSRAGEFLDKINGLSYEEIAARGGGILNSADRLGAMSENDLFDMSMCRLDEVIAKGTGAIEIKSGYGLTPDSEIKMLRVIARMADAAPIPVRATFLGAHAVGRAYEGRRTEYVDHIIGDMLPRVAAEGLADYVDVFCDRGFFTPDDTARILEAAAAFGIRPKIHANELDNSGGVEVGVAHGALSVDHLERADTAQFALLGKSDTVATMLPGASFFLGMPYGNARAAIEANTIVALASDYNPGSSPSGDMRFVWALGCIKMRLTPVRALNAVTVNGAYAMGLADSVGTIAPGHLANFIITRPGLTLTEIPYAYTSPWISTVYTAGRPAT